MLPVAACMEKAVPPAASLTLKHVYVNHKKGKPPFSETSRRKSFSEPTPEVNSITCQVISDIRHHGCFAGSDTLRLEAIHRFLSGEVAQDHTVTPPSLESEEAQRNTKQPRISRHVLSLNESLSQQCFPYYRRLWYHVTQNDWDVVHRIICKLQAQHLHNEVLLTFQLWSDALNIRKGPQKVNLPLAETLNDWVNCCSQALEKLAELERLPRVDPLIYRLNQNLLDSYFELRELRVLTVSNIVPNFCHIAWSSAAAVKERRLSRLRQRLRSMSADEALHCTIEDLRSMAQHDILQNPPVLEAVDRQATLAERVPHMRQRRQLALQQLITSPKKHVPDFDILEGASTTRTVDDLLGAALLRYAQDTGSATSKIGTLQRHEAIHVKQRFSHRNAGVDTHASELANAESKT